LPPSKNRPSASQETESRPIESRFRPWLDEPGVWPDWDLGAADLEGFTEDGRRAAAKAAARLAFLYGDSIASFGADDLVIGLAKPAPAQEDLQRLGLLLAACDHHRARLAVPRAAPGGLTNPANRRVWARLRPYLVARCRAVLAADSADALLWRAILGRVPDNWLPAAQLTRALERQFAASEDFSEVTVNLELKPQNLGGRRWIAAATRAAVAQLRQGLAARDACLVELLRDPAVAPSAASWVVVYRLQDLFPPAAEGEALRLWAYDPRRGAEPLVLRLRIDAAGVFAAETDPDDDLPAVKALRVMSLAPADPPRAGWRAWFTAVHPWGAFWWIKRQWLLFLTRKHDHKQGTPNAQRF
jgi:hypothetical protein